MGCGCKNDGEISVSGINIEEKKTFSDRLNYILFRKNKFSLGGLLFFLFLVPIVITIAVPFIVIVLFNQLVFGKSTDIVKFVAFTKNKKVKK